MISKPGDKKKKTRRPTISAKGKFCIACNQDDGMYVYDTVVVAHYSGDRKFLYGFGKSSKGDDRISAYLCRKHHAWMDGPARAELGDMAHSELFLHYTALSILQEE